MDAYDFYWKIKTIWMNNCKKISGTTNRPEHMKITVKMYNRNYDIIDAEYNPVTDCIELIPEEHK